MASYSAGDREGFTLVELLIVTVLGALVLGAMYQVLITNQRTYATQNANVQANQTLRGGMEALFSELREISPQDGDLLSMSATGMRVRASRAPAIVCSIVTGGNNPTVQVKRLGRYLTGDSARVFIDNDPSLTSDDTWQTVRVQVVDSTGLLACPDGEVAQTVRLQDGFWGPPPDSILPGAPVRNFVRHQYQVGTYDGQTYLTRTDENGDTYPLVGPLNPNNPVTFRYLDGSGAATGTPVNVRQIEVTLRSETNIRNLSGDLQQDSLASRIFTRN